MKSKHIQLLFLMILLCAASSVKAQLHTWIEPGGPIHAYNSYPYIRSIWCDANNNIYAAGDFTDSTGYRYVARFNGQTWSELGTGAHALNANAVIYSVYGDKAGNIYCSGNFTDSTGYQYVAKWNGTDWTELGTGANALNNPANFQITVVITDTAGSVYAAGALTDDSGYVAVVKWDGTKWNPVGTGANGLGINTNIISICFDPAGNLYAAGAFTDSGYANVLGHAYVAKWNGTRWSPLGTGANALLANSPIYTICSDPAGNIYAAGSFTDRVTDSFLVVQDGARYVAKWNGSNWTRLGGSTDTFAWAANSIDNITTITSDAAGNIYAAGAFRDTSAFLSNRTYVAKWDGTNWAEVGAVSNHQLRHGVFFSLCFDHWGNLYAAGDYGDTLNNIDVGEFVTYIPTSIVSLQQTDYDLFPNPSAGLLTLHSSEASDATLNLYDLNGRALQTWQCTGEGLKQLNIAGYAPGLYLLRIETSLGQTSVMKVVRE